MCTKTGIKDVYWGGPGGLPLASCDPCQRNGQAPCRRYGSKACQIQGWVVFAGHGAMSGTKKMPDLGLNSESGNACTAFFPFQNLSPYLASLQRDYWSHMMPVINHSSCHLQMSSLESEIVPKNRTLQ